MSKVLAMMLQPKRDIMYATIKGSLTESPEGVFSGFSASNYLQLQQNFAPAFEDNFEIEIKLKYVNPDNLNTNERILTQTNGSGFIIYNKQFGISLTDINNNTVVNTAFSFSTFTPQDNTIYFWKLKGGNGNYTFTIYDENHNKLADTTFTSTVALLPFNRLGSNAGTRYFNGSIDLNNSYIKLGSTKYKLKAVVGYKIIGSPTITDGVVSGFSSSDYLTTNQNFPNDLAYDDCEYQVKFTLPNSISQEQQIICVYFRGLNDGIRVTTGGRLRCFFGGTSNLLVSTPSYLTFGNTYVVRVINRNNKVSLYCGTDENNLQLVVSQDKVSFINQASRAERIGIDDNVNILIPFDGSIDLNKTYTKVRGKLWFNGQPA